MKRIKWIIGCFLLWGACACTEDKGNYDYTSLNNLTIDGIQPQTIEQFDRLSMPVTIKGVNGFDAARYNYLWQAWKTNNSAEPDTLSLEKDLDVEVKMAVGEYNLRYVVTDKETGVYYTAQTGLKIINSYSTGVIALSNVDGNANITFINALNRVTENVYESVNGEVAGKNPVGVFYTGGGEEVREVVVISTEEGSKVINPLDFSVMMDFSDFFYIKPDNQVMQCLCKSSWGADEFVIVGGKVYSRMLYGEVEPFQKYSPQIAGDYEMAPFSMHESEDPFSYFYDQKGKRFLCAGYWSSAMMPVETDPDEFDPTDMQATMAYGIAFDAEVRAVMDGDDGERFIIAIEKLYGYVTPLRKLVIDHPGFADATCFAVSSDDIDYLYYAAGNKIVCVGMQGGSFIAEFDLKPGEQVDYMEFERTEENPNRLYVGVSDGSGKAKSGSIYYLRMHSDGSLEEEAYFEKVCGKVVDFEYKP